MFKAPRWRNEKNRITAVFKFQFHVTQVTECGGNGLVLSVVPAENGKATAKLEKCTIRDNCCYWENPVYETVKFFQDPKSGKIQERFFYFIISTGKPNCSLVGEFSVNVADYVAATKACSISFPFKNSNPDSHLRVSIQRIEENANKRDHEESEDPRIKPEDRSLRRYFSNGDTEDSITTNSNEDKPLRKTVSHLSGLNGTRRASSGSDITMSSSDGSSGLNTPRELGARNMNTNKDQTPKNCQDQQGTRWELAIVPVNHSSTDNLNSPRDAFPSERSEMGSDYPVEKLKADLVALSRRADVSELELQTLRKQIVKESKKGQELIREITSLKEERDVLKDECEKLKAYRKRSDDFKVKSKFQFEGDSWTLLEEIREELNYEKDLNANLRLQLQKTQDSNAELILAVQDLEEILEKNERVSNLPNRSATSAESAVEIDESILKCQSSDDEEQKALEELVRQHSDAQETYLLEQKIMDLCSEIEMYRRDKDELEMHMEQLALDYEILKQENHEFSCRLEQSHLQEQLKMPYECSSSYAAVTELESQREKLESELEEKMKELSESSATIKELEARNHRLEEELEKQADGFQADMEAVIRDKKKQEERAARVEDALTQSNATIDQLKNQIEELKNELKKQSKDLSGSLATIKELETNNYNLEEQLEKQAQGFKVEMEGLVHAKTEQEQRALRAEEALNRSNAKINELGMHIRELENKLTKHSKESSDSFTTVKELEAHIQNLEEELEKQAEGFNADLEAITHAKVEQEQRAIRAEDALKLMRWKNANTAARIQDEFKKLSMQMQSSFEANEKLASQAMAEASALRLQNRHLQDMHQKANKDLRSAQDDYEAKLHDLYSQINMKSAQIEQMVLEIEQKSKQFENQKKHTDEVHRSLSGEQLELRSKVERITAENKLLAEQADQGEKLRSELEQMKALIRERDLLFQRESMERSVKGVAGKSLEEVNVLRHLKDEKEHAVMNLQSEMEALRAQCDNLKHSLYEDELEKERLRKQVFQLKADLKKKDEAISSVEKKLKENIGRAAVQDRLRATSKNTKPEPVQRGSKEVVTLKEKIKLLEGQIKSKETALETSANAFLAKEKDLHGKIEELEVRLGDYGQISPGFDQDKVDEEKVSIGLQVDCDPHELTSSGEMPEEVSTTSEYPNNVDLIESEEQVLSDTQLKTSDNNFIDDQKFDRLLKEMVLLKERNTSMETELKEMQERYSEISLKFAEVEGERQKLVMTLRNFKNAKKS